MKRLAWLVVLSAMASSPAWASPRPFTWAYTTDTGLEGDSSTELWVDLGRDADAPDPANHEVTGWDLWWGFTTTPVENLELAVYAIGSNRIHGLADWPEWGAPGFSFSGVEGQVRWHFAGPLLLFAKVNYQSTFGLGGEALLVIDHTFGPARLTANIGPSVPQTPWARFAEKTWVTGKLDLAASFALSEAFRLGLEAQGEYVFLGLENATRTKGMPSSAFLGPTIFYGKGKLWAALNASYGAEFFTGGRAPGVWSRLIIGANF